MVLKLTVAQSSVLMAIGGMMALLLADILDFVDISTTIFVTTSLVLAIVAHQILPSLKELKRMVRRP